MKPPFKTNAASKLMDAIRSIQPPAEAVKHVEHEAPSNAESGTQISAGHDEKGNVVLAFDKPITWLKFPAENAIELAKLIVHHAAQAQHKAHGGIVLPPGAKV